MQDTDLTPTQIEAINFARLWPFDENNRHNEKMLNFQELALDPEWVPEESYVLGILTIKLSCSRGDTDKFGCIVGGCTELFDSENERDSHQEQHLAQFANPIPPPAAQPAPQPTSPQPTVTPRRASSSRSDLDCFGCDFKGTYAAIMAHKPSCPKTKYQTGNSTRTFKGGYHNAFYACFNCEYFTSDLARVKAHAAAGCSKRAPDATVGYDFITGRPGASLPMIGTTAFESNVGWVVTEHGWEDMPSVAAKINGQASTPVAAPAPPPAPTIVPNTPVPQPSSGIDLSALPDGRYASIDINGRVWFFHIKRRKNASSGWGYKKLNAGDIEVKRYESDTLHLIGVQKVTQNQLYKAWTNMTQHNDDLTYILANPSACAKLFARESERCYVCGKRLTDPDSKQRGIGPDCYAQGKGFAVHHR